MAVINWSFDIVQDTAQTLQLANVVLESGQVGVETDSLLFKIGDGATLWTDLPYALINGQQSVWMGVSTDIDNTLTRSVNDGGILLSNKAFISPTEYSTILTNASQPILGSLDVSNPIKAATFNALVLLRKIIECLGPNYLDLKQGNYAGDTLDVRFNDLEADVAITLAVIADGTIALNKTWSSTKIDNEMTTRVSSAIAGIVGSSPAALDTLYEIAAVLQDNPAIITAILTNLGETVRFETVQTLTASQKLTARTNIDAASWTMTGDYTNIDDKLLLTWLNEALADSVTAAVLPSSYI